jgi:hypothetical protein
MKTDIEALCVSTVQNSIRTQRELDIHELRKVRDELRTQVVRQEEPVSVRLNGGMEVR